ncbi:MAG: thiamine-phosphate kinase, partial [Myxococcota bacterium]|nr:thiamine-phosphate kinase [Myxococcota bacterium]
MKELDIIHELTKGCNLAPKMNGVGDDCALLQGNGIVTTDTMVEGVHFDDRLSPSDVGWKLVAVNASDIAAMGRYPSWATLNLTLPKAKNKDWLIEFSKGMRSALSEWDISLVGGDVVRGHKHVVASMTMGAFGRKKLVWQHEAAVKNTIWVTGYLGEAAAGFFDKNEEGLKWLRRPYPPIEFGHNLGNIGIATSMIDISDGLHQDLTRLCMR